MKLQTKTCANLKLLGKVIVEKKGKPHEGQGDLFPDIKMRPEKRKQLGVPRRRAKGKHPDIPGKRKGDKPSSRRPPGFEPEAHGERKSDVSARAAEVAAGPASRERKAVEQEIKQHVTKASAEGKPEYADVFARVAAAIHAPKMIGGALKSAVRPIKFKPSKARKQNPHTATSPID